MSTIASDTLEGCPAVAADAAYSLLAGALRYPDSAFADALARENEWAWVSAVVEGYDPAAAEDLRAWRGRAAASARSARSGEVASCLRDDLSAAHLRLFGHSVRGACPLYEMEYGHGEIVQQAPQLADITGFYAAFGLEVVPEFHERADHVSVECEFMALLSAKEVYAAEHGDNEGGDIVRGAQRAFLEAHLGRWLPALCRRIIDGDPAGFYSALARFATSFMTCECARFNVPQGPQFLELRPTDPTTDASIDCGAEENCPGGGDRLVQLGIEAHG